MTDIDNGGQAFPGPAFTRTGHPKGHDMGMTLRDWFAGQALAGKMSIDSIEYLTPQDIAERCYRQSDAMLAARGSDQ